MISGNHVLACGLLCMPKKNKKVAPPRPDPTDEATGIDGPRLLWHEDGPNDSVNSLSVLLDWLTTEGNYARYRGSDDDGRTPADGVIDKKGYCTMISELISKQGIRKHRTADAIKNKIASIAGDWATAHDFLNRTGAGIEDEMTLQDAVKKRCALYYILAPTFASQGNASSFTNEDDDFSFRELAIIKDNEIESDDDSANNDTDLSTSTLNSVRSTTRGPGSTRTSVTPAAVRTAGEARVNTASAETPQTENTRRRMEFLIVGDITTTTKKLRRGCYSDDTPENKFYAEKMSFNQDKLKVDNGRLELEKEKEKRAAALFEIEKIEMKAKIMREHLNMKMQTQKYWKQAVEDGIYSSIDDAKKDYPLPPEPTFPL
jgi:hypothetical protein